MKIKTIYLRTTTHEMLICSAIEQTLTRESFHVQLLSSRYIYLRSPINEIHVTKIRIRITTHVAQKLLYTVIFKNSYQYWKRTLINFVQEDYYNWIILYVAVKERWTLCASYSVIGTLTCTSVIYMNFDLHERV